MVMQLMRQAWDLKVTFFDSKTRSQNLCALHLKMGNQNGEGSGDYVT